MRVKCVYDNGGKTADRFTIVYNVSRMVRGERMWECVGASLNPTHPQGFFQHTECRIGTHLGKRIAFDSLPEEVRKAVKCDLESAHDEH